LDIDIYFMKTCTKCKIDKDINDFHKSSASKDGYKSICKSCISIKEKERINTPEYKEKYKEYIKSIPKDVRSKRSKKYYEDNKDKVLVKNSKYRSENKEKLKEVGKSYRDKNKDKLKEKKKLYRSDPKNKEKQKEWRLNNPDKIKFYRKKYLGSDKVNEHRNNWYKSVKKRKPYLLAWRSVLTNTLKRLKRKKEEETIKLLGYSALQLKEHIENLFLEGMSWDNYGEWHIDHKKMVSSFDPETPIHIVNSLDNLRPLWAEDNCSRKLN